MKKLLALMLAAALALSLTACGGDTFSESPSEVPSAPPTKEEMLQTAEHTTMESLNGAIFDNVVRAEDDYVGKAFIIPGFVDDITEDGCVLCDNESFRYFITAKLPTDELKTLDSGDLVSVVGLVSEFEEGESAATAFGSYPEYYVTLDNAYLVDGITEFSGTVMYEIGATSATGDPLYRTYIKMPITTETPQKIILQNTLDFDISRGDEITITGTDILECEYDFEANSHFSITLDSRKMKVDIKKQDS